MSSCACWKTGRYKGPFFKPDDRKDGGAYVTVAGRIKKIDLVERNIILLDGTIVPIDALYQIYSEA